MSRTIESGIEPANLPATRPAVFSAEGVDRDGGSGETAVRVSGLTFRYGRRPVLDDIDLDVPAGSSYAVVGRNGVGKTSLVHLLCGLRSPERGELTVLGRDPALHRAQLVEEIGVVLERPTAPPDATLASLARLTGTLRDVPVDTICSRLARWDLPLGSRFGELSRGQQGQVGLQLALAGAPRLLVLDDPFLGLDVVARAELVEALIEEMAQRDLTVLFTSHDLDLVHRLATHVAVLRGGRVAASGPLDAMLRAESDGRSLEEILAGSGADEPVAGSQHAMTGGGT
ncbi:MAG: ATP-binding cassette domain-containing protein [Acidobacteria bacterium]|nr:MAG: ATP-binding cassette domain-containing protein [Acidobacteriota bacterium]REK01023.1 MAG: ATP-binding cassette domain-containing protein [Acidobacteriota bacterium]